MKTLIIIREREYEWLYQVFPDPHPLLIPICNKPFIEFLIDFSILAGSEAIRFVSDGSLRDVEHYCEQGSRWGVQISYASMQVSDDLTTVTEKNRRYCSDARVLIISGFIFIRYDKQNDYKALFTSLPPGEFRSCNLGSLTLTGTQAIAENAPGPVPLSLVGLENIGVYYQLCNEILSGGSLPYVLPGYSNETDCHIGRNVVMSKSCEIRKPVIIGNNVQILAGTVIGPEAIIGNNVIIDRESTVSRSIVLDNTYIGEHLDLNNRIAAGNILVEPESGAAITMDDPHLLTGMRTRGKTGAFLDSLVHILMAGLLILLQLIPFLLLLPILKLQNKWKKSRNTYYTSTSGKTVTLSTAAIERSGPLSFLASALSLDRFPLLFRVLSGELALIASQPLAATPGSRATLSRMTGYQAGVFSYAEAEDWPVNGSDTAIVERFYATHGNPLLDITMTLKALFNRIHEKQKL